MARTLIVVEDHHAERELRDALRRSLREHERLTADALLAMRLRREGVDAPRRRSCVPRSSQLDPGGLSARSGGDRAVRVAGVDPALLERRPPGRISVACHHVHSRRPVSVEIGDDVEQRPSGEW